MPPPTTSSPAYSTTDWPAATRRCGSANRTATRPSPSPSRLGLGLDRCRPRGAVGAALHRDRARHRAVRPDELLEPQPVDQQLVGRADAHRRRRHVDVDHVPGRSAAGQAEAPALADRDQLDGVDPSDLGPPLVDHAPRTQGDAIAQEPGAPGGRGHEAHVLAVGLVGGAQAERGRLGPHLVLGQVARPGSRVRASSAWPSTYST